LSRRVIEKEGSVESQIAQRQLALKTSGSNSWFIYVDSVLSKYGLPSAHNIMEERIPLSAWKKTIKSVVYSHWEQKLRTNVNKNSIRFMSQQSLGLDTPALLRSSAMSTPREAQKARIKAKLMCGVLRLRVHDHLWSKGKADEVTPTCLMCSLEAENRKHFLLRCPALRDICGPHLMKLYNTLAGSDRASALPLPEDILLQLLLDSTHPSCQLLQGEDEVSEMVEAISREMMFRMYKRRLDLLDFKPTKRKRRKRGTTSKREDQS
jgi:hypothetical protein